jgi:ABC-type multidrug transport system ATPase subunit
MQEVKILQNLSGVFKPGRICLLLGPPGGGKSMLMKALCGAAPVQV